MTRTVYILLLLAVAWTRETHALESTDTLDFIPEDAVIITQKRTPLIYMTAGFIGAQFAIVHLQRDDDDWKEEGHRFEDGFKHAPVWEDDAWHYNYGLHPWVGSEYYLVSRNRGHSRLLSLAYSAALSTFFEFIPENTIQSPSAVDLLVTPLCGSLLGELRYLAKEKLREDPTPVPGARLWIALLDPLDISLGGSPDGTTRLCFNWTHTF
jgi:hypothetical protein